MTQLSVPLYPILIIAADGALAGVLVLTAPALGVLMAVVALSVVAAVIIQARPVSFVSQSEIPYDG